MAKKKKVKELEKVAGPINDFAAIVLFALGLFSIISFLSFQLGASAGVDVSIPDLAKQNTMGPLGYYLAVMLNGLLGWAGILFPLVCFALAAYNAFRRDGDFNWYLKPLSLFAIILATILIAGLATTYFGRIGGGELGLMISAPLIKYFNFLGAVLVQLTLAIVFSS